MLYTIIIIDLRSSMSEKALKKYFSNNSLIQSKHMKSHQTSKLIELLITIGFSSFSIDGGWNQSEATLLQTFLSKSTNDGTMS